MNISLVHSSSISKINSPYIYFGTSYKNILKLKKESNYPIINYEGELNEIAQKEEKYFLNWIERKRKKNNDSIYWWMNQLAGRNNLSSNFFLYLCQFFFIKKYLKKRKINKICIVCENYYLQDFLYLNLKKKYKCTYLQNFFFSFFFEKVKFFVKKIIFLTKEVIKIIIQIVFAKITRPKKLYMPKKDTVLFHHCVNSFSEKINKKKICNYFSDLPNLCEKNKKIEISSLFWTYSGFLKLKFYKSMRKKNSFIPEDWLNFFDYIKIFFNTRKIKFTLKKKLNYKENLNINSLINLELNEHETVSSFKFLMYIPALKKWSNRIKKLTVFDQYQNMIFEHCLRFACQDLKIKTKTIGYHHSLMSRGFLGYRSTKSEWESKTRPDKIFTIGKLAKKTLLSGGVPRKKIVETFSLRQQKFKKVFQNKKNKNILLVLPLKKNLSLEICEKMMFINEKLLDLNFKIFVKTHPFLGNKELLKYLSWDKLPNNWYWSKDDLRSGLDSCYLVVTTSSAAVYDIIIRGNIPIIINSDLNLMDNYLDIFEGNEKNLKFQELKNLPKFLNNLISKKNIFYHNWIQKVKNNLVKGINPRSSINEKKLINSIT
jgi:hypothetical protein